MGSAGRAAAHAFGMAALLVLALLKPALAEGGRDSAAAHAGGAAAQAEFPAEIVLQLGHSGSVNSVAFSPDGKTALSGNIDNTVRLWDLATDREIRKLEGHSEQVNSVAFSPDGKTALSGSLDHTARLWDLATGREIRKFEGHSKPVTSVAFSPDGKTALSGSRDHTIRLWDLATGREIRKIEGHSGWFFSVAFSPDGKTALSGSWDNTARLWDLAAGREIRKFEKHSSLVESVAFSPDGKTALSGSAGKGLFGTGEIKLWDLATGREIRKLEGHSGAVSSVAFSPDGKTALSGSMDHTVRLWDLAEGREIRKLEGHSAEVSSVAFSPDGKTALSGSHDGTMRLWNIQSGEELAALIATRDGEYMTFTPSGFFAASHRDTDMLAIARGMEVTTIGQVYQSLYNPDLVREALAGDPNGQVKRAAEVINLDKVLDSGPAPSVEITSHPSGSKSGKDIVTVTARIKDRGKGIGRIEWRVKGITVGVTNAPAGAGPVYEVKRELALDPGKNAVEAVAYNASNILASLPAQTTIAYTGLADSVKPRLHILAIGIDTYADKGWTPPGGQFGRVFFPPLSLAAGDAEVFAADLQRAGAGMYSEVRVKTLLDAQATAAIIGAAFKAISADIAPRDTFVLFAAAHGYSERGRFYLIPQDYQGGNNPAGAQRDRPGAPAGMDGQYQGQEGDYPARHLRVGGARERLHPFARGLAGLGGGGGAAARSDGAPRAHSRRLGQARNRGRQAWPRRFHLRAHRRAL
ncbi:MAG: eIF2A-related protein [Rhodomicrobium sp.]